MKPLFIPLNTKYFEQFLDGTKCTEYRRYGTRWNERTCEIGRRLILSKGYGKAHRLSGHVTHFEKRHGTTFSADVQADILDVYQTLDIDIACIKVDVAQPPCKGG